MQLSQNGQPLDSALFTIDHAKSLLILSDRTAISADSLELEYRVFPFDLSASYEHKDPKNIAPDATGTVNPFKYTYQKQENSLFNLKGLDKQGSISRGINFGNNQNLSVNSNLNLQLSGRVNEKVSILAAISDENIPIQPEGNTQQLQEFDRVYVQLFDKRSKLTAGDFQLGRPTSYYMNYYKRAQGGSFETRIPLSTKDTAAHTMDLKASAAVSRGKFARNIIQGVEGNQGPYRLRGANNETFIIILSGTERIYIDGKLLTRGQENDYIIDYNTSELIFSAKEIITKDKRIVAEFQYSDKNYARSILQFSDAYHHKNLNLRFHAYSEQDSKNQPLQQELTAAQREVLRNVGDSLSQALAPGVDTGSFEQDLIQYALIDSTVFDAVLQDSITYPVYRFSNDPELAIYRLTFSNVGLNGGNYLLDKTTANGKIYRWIAPIGDVPQGNFEPIVLLVAPQQRQMFTLGGDYKISKNTVSNFEVALSNQDVNTFSKKDRSDNTGYAFVMSVENNSPLGDSGNAWVLNSAARFEQLDRNFNEIERFRTVEFDRDWNIRDIQLQESQNIAGASIGVSKANFVRFLYNIDLYDARSEYRAFKNNALIGFQKAGFNIAYDASLVQSNGDIRKTDFLRHKTLASKQVKSLIFGYRDDYEKNQFFDPATDSLQATSYEFWEWEVFATNADTVKNRYKVNYIQRKDKAPRNNQLDRATIGETVGFSFDLLKNPKHILRGKTSYRQLRIRDKELTAQEPENTILGRLEYNLKLLKGAITSTSFYEIGSGLEARKEFTYVEVSAGQGTHTWRDNGDELQDLNEFEISIFQDQANFIKVFTPTDDYVKVFTNQFNQSFFIRPAVVWRNKTGARKFVSHFSDQVAFRVDRKTNEEDGADRFNPFLQGIADSTLQSLNSSFRNTFYFNRSHPKFGADLGYQDIRGKTLLTNGFESRSNTFITVSSRWNLTRVWTFNSTYTDGDKVNKSDVFSSRNFDINYFSVEPEIAFQPNTKIRVSLFYNYTEKKNSPNPDDETLGDELAINQTIGTDVKFNSVGKGSFLMNFSFIQNRYNGETSSSLAFEMLEGLQPGQNATWSVSYLRTIAKNLQLSLNYNGRKSKDINMIHAGGVQVRAFF